VEVRHRKDGETKREGARLLSEQYIGKSIPRVDALAKVRGTADFPGDLSMPGMAHMKVLFARRSHARILHIDTEEARSYPGVLAVLTARDVPVNSYGIGEYDQPVICEDIVRFVGDRVALVVAENEQIAARARALIRVDYEDLQVINSPEDALLPDAPILHPAKNSNILTSLQIRKGDVQSAESDAPVIIDETYDLGGQEHAYLQPDAGLAWVDQDGCIVVKTAGQWAHDDRRQIAHALSLPEECIRVIYTYAGGAFGGREDVSVHILLALAVLKIGRPVKVIWSREETTIGHHKRHAMKIQHRWGATRDGQLIFQKTKILADAGAYASTSAYVVASTLLTSTGPYNVPHVAVDAQAVFTNNVTGGAFRGFGVPQAITTAEAQMARLAEALDIDPVELRLRNMFVEGSRTSTQAEVPAGLSARETLVAAAQAVGWQKESGKWVRPDSKTKVGSGILRGVGIASGWKNVGYTLGYPEEATASIELHGRAEIERAVVRLGTSEVGQGTLTTIKQMAADALNLPLELVELIFTDTAQTASAGSVSASRMAFMAGNVLRETSEAVMKAWRNEDRPAVVTHTYKAPSTDALDPQTGAGVGAFAFAYLAQAVELEVDPETGQLNVLRIVSAHDVGRAIHPQIVEGQIEGGVIQGLGWAMMEDFQSEEGQVLTPDLTTYLIPTARDIPTDLESVVLELNLPLGPWGVTGVGEMSLLAIAPALIDALHDATGVWFNVIPLPPERVFEGLRRRAKNP
jgi:CO/xanthine dehydrogenase Mo-binding subunit